jgi:hypothetical protein
MGIQIDLYIIEFTPDLLVLKLKLIQSALPEKDDTKYETTNKRNVMTVAVSRYMSQTSRMVENTSLGRFPDSTTVN